MANKDRPRGFEPYGEVKQKVKLQAGGTVYPNDAVQMNSSGQMVVASAGSVIMGVALEYATSGNDVMCSVAPDQLYTGQADETELNAQTDVGNNCDILDTSGDSTYKVSRMEVDSSSVTAAAAQLTIIGLHPGTSNSFGAQADVIVKINEHQAFGEDAFAGI